ncbi:MAG: TlpA disulfide reductase family protein [Balneolaceae bacterium]|nr:TlpA disulfide reductase family protein [Balneolaceae bacterium]
MKESKGINWKKEALNWAGIIGIIALLYVTGWHKPISATLQRAILWTGIIQADTELPESEQTKVDYNMPLVTLDGKKANLNQFRGKVIFLNYWATWCPPCIAEMPSIQELYETYKQNPDVAFVMINLDENVEKAKSFLENKKYTFGSYRRNGRTPPVFRSSIIPTTFVISKEGKLVAKKRGMANYNTVKFRSFFKSLLNN